MARAERYRRAGLRWLRLLTRRHEPAGVRVFYGHDVVPGPGDPVAGGTGKFQRLAQRFPNSPTGFSLLYLGSTWLPRDVGPLLAYARRRRIPLVVNQSGVAYPGWAGSETTRINDRFRRPLLAADHVLYQSEFCKRSADEWLGEPRGSWEILYNAVDVRHFAPADGSAGVDPVLLLGGDPGKDREATYARWAKAMQLPQVRGLVAGRTLLYPPDGNVGAAVDAAAAIVRRA